MQPTMKGWLAAVVSAAAISVAMPVRAAAMYSRASGCDQQAFINVSDRPAHSSLDAVRRDCPLLGQIIEKFAMQDLGEEAPMEIAAPHSREIAIVAESAASGDVAGLRRFTQVALANGAQPVEFEEMLYVTAVNAGILKAVDATRAITDLIVSPIAEGCVEAPSQF